MRTTLNIDDDILLAAREIARRERTSIGAVVSELALAGLNASSRHETSPSEDGFFGFHPLPKRGRPVTNDLIDRLRTDGPY